VHVAPTSLPPSRALRWLREAGPRRRDTATAPGAPYAAFGPAAAARQHPRASENRQVAVQFERGDLMTVVPPFFPLVAQEEVEHVLAERFGHQLAVLHPVQCLVQALRQRLDAEDAALAFGERPYVVRGLGRQFVAGLDALEAGRQDRGEGQVRVARGVQRPEL